MPITPGPKGSVFWYEGNDGIKRTTAALIAITKSEIPKTLDNIHLRAIGTLSGKAERIFKESIRRRDEHGWRPEARETTNFTFGGGIHGGRAFTGVLINPTTSGLKDTYGFGYPNVPQADEKTHFVWRSLEFGLAPAPVVPSEFAPRGKAQFPTKFTFIPFRTGIGRGSLQPLSRTAARTGSLMTPQGRFLKKVAHPGIHPKQFITTAFEETVPLMNAEYQKMLGSTFKDWRKK